MHIGQASHFIEDGLEDGRENHNRVSAATVGRALLPLEIITVQFVWRLATLA